MKFADIRGQQDIKAHLQNAIARQKVSHAYIISGEKDSGKMMLAEAFAATLMCEAHGPDACGECHSCKQAWNHNHPDIRYVTHEKPNSFGVEDIRTQINQDIVIKPYSSKYKIYIMNEAKIVGEMKASEATQESIMTTILRSGREA